MLRWTAVITAVTVVLAFSSQSMGVFIVDGTSYVEKFSDNFDDGVIDTAKWPTTTYITESAVAPGTLTHTTITKKTTTSANFGAQFTGETEWAYLFRVQVPDTMISVGNRCAYVFRTPDIDLLVFKNSGTVWQLWAGNTYYTSGTFYYKSGNLNLNQFYKIGVHKKEGVNQYDIFIDDVEVASDVASNTYSPPEVPATISFGHASSTGNFPGIYDYLYAGVPEPATLGLLAIGAVGMLIRRRTRQRQDKETDDFMTGRPEGRPVFLCGPNSGAACPLPAASRRETQPYERCFTAPNTTTPYTPNPENSLPQMNTDEHASLKTQRLREKK